MATAPDPTDDSCDSDVNTSPSITLAAYRHYEDGIPHRIEVPDTSIYDILVESAQFYPERPAINYFGNHLTYAQFHALVRRACQVLHEAGVRRGDVVAVCLPNCPQHLVVFYALARLGAACASHNPLAPKSEVMRQVGRHGARVAVVWEKSLPLFDFGSGQQIKTVFSVDLTFHMPYTQKLALKLPVTAAREARQALRGKVSASVLSWDRLVKAAKPLPASVEGATADDILAILHTGGNNGEPKSVPLTHRNVGANAAQNLAWAHRLHEGAETFFSLLPYFHSFGLTFFMVCAVKIAANQVVLPKFDVDRCLQIHRRQPVTFFVGVPPMFSRIAKAARTQGVDISSIRYAISGAMPLSNEVAKEWEDLTGGIIVEGYGMTETAPTMTGSPINAGRRHGSLGVPFPSTEMRLGDLTDPNREPKPGEPGEILVRGPQVFSGYLGAGEADNAKHFTADGYFRTGDIGTCDDGFVYLIDRSKELILYGGFNVYPSRVEAAIGSHEAVKEVVVVGLPGGEDGTEEVVAAIVPAEGAARPTLEQIRQWAEREVPHYALPRRLEFIDAVPLSAIGKVLRREVRELLLKRS